LPATWTAALRTGGSSALGAHLAPSSPLHRAYFHNTTRGAPKQTNDYCTILSLSR
jgi:hypothetical protein